MRPFKIWLIKAVAHIFIYIYNIYTEELNLTPQSFSDNMIGCLGQCNEATWNFAAFQLPEFCTASMPLFQLLVLENVFRAHQEFEATWSIPASFEPLQYLGTCRCVFSKIISLFSLHIGPWASQNLHMTCEHTPGWFAFSWTSKCC